MVVATVVRLLELFLADTQWGDGRSGLRRGARRRRRQMVNLRVCAARGLGSETSGAAGGGGCGRQEGSRVTAQANSVPENLGLEVRA